MRLNRSAFRLYSSQRGEIMNKRKFITFLASVSVTSALLSASSVNAVTAENSTLPQGWLLWHNYSNYSALDSKLYLRSPDGAVQTVEGDFIHAMNGHFGASPFQFTFMAIDEKADEWDIFLCDNGKITNLTQNSGFRNEDPKFSPDGRNIVFKRGYWSNSADNFVYDLAVINVETGDITMLTDTPEEEAMPCFSSDGKSVYYALYNDSIGSIHCLDTETKTTETIYNQSGINAYYPVVMDSMLYFTAWTSSDNHCDRIMCFDGERVTPLPFNCSDYDCSDACPIDDNTMIFSSTAEGSYDLFFYDGESATRLSELSTDINELGADFYSYDEYNGNTHADGDVNADGVMNIADLVLLSKWLLDSDSTQLNDPLSADLCSDGVLDVFDLCAMRVKLLSSENE